MTRWQYHLVADFKPINSWIVKITNYVAKLSWLPTFMWPSNCWQCSGKSVWNSTLFARCLGVVGRDLLELLPCVAAEPRLASPGPVNQSEIRSFCVNQSEIRKVLYQPIRDKYSHLSHCWRDWCCWWLVPGSAGRLICSLCPCHLTETTNQRSVYVVSTNQKPVLPVQVWEDRWGEPGQWDDQWDGRRGWGTQTCWRCWTWKQNCYQK